jgi:ABC-2 type transport system permease protein
MNVQAIMAIVEKDLRVLGQSKGVMIPLIVVPLLVSILMPGVLGILPRFVTSDELTRGTNFETLLAQFPATLQAQLAGYNEMQMFVVLILVYYLAPMYLILPLMVSSVIAADSVAGEKERKTLEALLYTPTSDRDLFVAKLLAAWVPAVLVSWLGFGVYSLTANWAAYPIMGEALFPNTLWLWLALWVAPAVAGLGLSFTVLISARVGTFQEAYQLGAIIVLPLVALIISQATGVLILNERLVSLLGLGIWIINGVLFWLGARTMHRPRLAARL